MVDDDSSKSLLKEPHESMYLPGHTQILLCDGAEFSKCSFAAIIIFDMIIFSTLGWRWIPPPEMSPDTKKTPEMNELETDKIALKI